MNRLSGQMQGVEISTQAAIDAGAQETELVQVMDQQTVALAGCLKFFMTAFLKHYAEHGQHVQIRESVL